MGHLIVGKQNECIISFVKGSPEDLPRDWSLKQRLQLKLWTAAKFRLFMFVGAAFYAYNAFSIIFFLFFIFFVNLTKMHF